MRKLEYDFLRACHEVVLCQQELLPHLASAEGIRQEDLYYTWMTRRLEQLGYFLDGEWGYCFHGLECDLAHRSDGRFLRVDFGPQGRTDTFSGWGVLQFVMTSKAPWREFPELQAHLAAKPPPYNSWSGSYDRMATLWKRMEELGLVELADPELYSFVERHTTVEPGGRRVLSYPEDLPERTSLDTLVSYLCVISAQGKQALADGGCT
jgi:hypothetical protein